MKTEPERAAPSGPAPWALRARAPKGLAPAGLVAFGLRAPLALRHHGGMTPPPSSPPSPPPLNFGPYHPPAFELHGWLVDERLGLVRVNGWTHAPIGWPRLKQPGPAVPVVTAELARAIRTESAIAVAHWWGVSRDRVQRWRRELDVGQYTEGTKRLLRDNVVSAPEPLKAQRLAALQRPESHAKAGAARRGKPASPALRAALLKGAKKPKSAEWASKASAWMLEGKRRKKMVGD